MILPGVPFKFMGRGYQRFWGDEVLWHVEAVRLEWLDAWEITWIWRKEGKHVVIGNQGQVVFIQMFGDWGWKDKCIWWWLRALSWFYGRRIDVKTQNSN